MICTFLLILSPLTALADASKIEAVAASSSGSGWRFDVTISHPDTGWEHYADGWEVLDADNNSLGLRVLVHPHVNEQPFTRGLGSVAVPEGTKTVFIRARCNIDGWSDEIFEVTLP